MQTPNPTIYLIDDNEAICQAIIWLLEPALGLPIVQYNDPLKFLNDYQDNLYGCLIIDVLMPNMSGLELLELLKNKGNKMPAIIITGHGDIPITVKGMQAGAKDFITKPFDSQQLIEKIKTILDAYSEQYKTEQFYRSRIASLTARERTIMKLIATGKLNKQIAYELGIALKTVELHRSHIMRKLKIRTVAELVHINIKSESE